MLHLVLQAKAKQCLEQPLAAVRSQSVTTRIDWSYSNGPTQRGALDVKLPLGTFSLLEWTLPATLFSSRVLRASEIFTAILRGRTGLLLKASTLLLVFLIVQLLPRELPKTAC